MSFRLLVTILASMPFLFAALAAAQEISTVKIGAESKRSIGTITAAQRGDVACYLTLKDDRGAAFKEMADFAICDQKPSRVGKRVALGYELVKVTADECQGDPGCKKSRTVALVTSAKIVDAKAARSGAATGSKQASFCTPAETVVFACHTGAKLVSVCASGDAAADKGYVQYRFGTPGTTDPVELVLPEGQAVPARAVTGGVMGFSGGGGAWMRFRKGAFAYAVYTGIGNWGPNGEKRTKEGLLVERDGKPIAVLKCSDEPQSELGPDWFEKVGIKANNEDFDFPD